MPARSRERTGRSTDLLTTVARIASSGHPPAAMADAETRICRVEGCPNRVYARGWCVKHDHRQYKHGSLELRKPGPCAVDGCARQGPLTRGWCPYHDTTWRRLGDPQPCENPGNPDRTCSAPGCDRVA